MRGRTRGSLVIGLEQVLDEEELGTSHEAGEEDGPEAHGTAPDRRAAPEQAIAGQASPPAAADAQSSRAEPRSERSQRASGRGRRPAFPRAVAVGGVALALSLTGRSLLAGESMSRVDDATKANAVTRTQPTDSRELHVEPSRARSAQEIVPSRVRADHGSARADAERGPRDEPSSNAAASAVTPLAPLVVPPVPAPPVGMTVPASTNQPAPSSDPLPEVTQVEPATPAVVRREFGP